MDKVTSDDSRTASENQLASSIEQGVTRLELIDEGGRRYTRWNCRIALLYQDQGRTLKVLVGAKDGHPDQET